MKKTSPPGLPRRHFLKTIGAGTLATLYARPAWSAFISLKHMFGSGHDAVIGGQKSRIIVLTDISGPFQEPDDIESLVRLMLYANEIDVEGIITTPSCWEPTVGEPNYQRIVDVIKAYGRVRSNLLAHAGGYPTEQYLLDRAKHGTPSQNMVSVGDGKGNEGSGFIISVVDKPDPRPLWITAWTGLTTLAQALWDVRKTRTPEQVNVFANKLRVYDIDGQDDSGGWIMKNFPAIKYMRSDWQFYGMSVHPNAPELNYGDQDVVSHSWLARNIRSVGPLGAAYPDFIYGDETDTPSFLYTLRNGLNDPDQQTWGGWGGRFTEDKVLNPPVCEHGGKPIDESADKPFYGYKDDIDNWYYPADNINYINNPFAGVARWRDAFQNEMAVRMLWSVNPNYDACNHNPIVRLNGDKTKNILTIKAKAGKSVKLNAAGTKDPDGDELSYKWYVYKEPGTYSGNIQIDGANTIRATVRVPTDATNDSIHVILEVTDNGKAFPLTSYRRAVIKTGNGGVISGTVTTVNDNVTGTNDEQFEYVGSWKYRTNQFRSYEDDNHYSGSAGDFFNVRFNGIRIKLYGVIHPTHGSADVSIDSGAPATITFYGPVPEGDLVLYKSPVLSPGQHTMKVVVKGNGFVVPDRVEIIK